MSSTRPRLTPAVADVRRAVRGALADLSGLPNAGLGRATGPRPAPAWEEPGASPAFGEKPLVLVALSGGPDSLALAAATAFEANRVGLRAGAVIVDHQLQRGSADAATRAAAQARELGLAPVVTHAVVVGTEGGPEAAARTARYAALDTVAAETGAVALLLGHTRDDQAESVLLGLARGSGATSLAGMDASSGLYVRPLLGIPRETTVQFCADSGLQPWLDPHNDDESYTRVRVRKTVLPLLERILGPGIREALVRTADQLREDSDALDHFAHEIAEDLAEHSEAGISLPVRALQVQPAALRQRLIRLAILSEFHVSISRVQTLEVARLVTDWRGQGAVHLPGLRVERQAGLLLFRANGVE
jgi:tRNA(Ile)-lysidine synthase